jgi:hypothetical protein
MNKRIPLLIIFLLFFNMVTGMMIPQAGAASSSSLQSLALSTGSLKEAFDPNTKAYTATVPIDVSNITVTPTVSERSTAFGYALFAGGSSPSGLTISGNSNTIVGNVHVNGDLSLKGNNNGITQTAEVFGSVNNHNGVIGELVQPAASLPFPQINLTEFKKNASKTYSASLNLSDVILDGNVFVDGDVTISGSKVQGKGTILATGSIHIAGSKLKYSSTNDSVIFYSLNGDIHIAGSDGEIDGGFFAPNGQVKLTGHENKIYGSVIVKDIDIAGSQNQIINDSQLGSAVVRINDKVVPSGMASQSIPLNVGPNTIKVDVTEFDGTLNSYTVTVTRTSNNADLFNLTVTSVGGTDVPLSPTFDQETLDYSASVGNEISTVAIQAAVEDPTATVNYKSPDGTELDPKHIQLAVGSNTIQVIVTAEDGTQKTYTITITRAGNTHANLSNLTINSGTLSPVFAPDKLSYTGNVPAGTQSVRVTATAADEGSAITVNGVPSQSGKPSEPISLVAGTNTIKVTVTAPDGTMKTYTITISKSEVPPMFSLSQQMIIGDYVMVKITPDQSTIMDNTEWFKYDLKDGQRQWTKFATGQFKTTDGNAVTGITLSSTVDDNGAAHFVDPQTVLIKAVTNGLSTEKPLAVNFSSTNGRIDGNGYKFKIVLSNGGTQNMATSGNRAAKISIVYNITVSDGLSVNFVNGTPNYVMKDQSGNRVLEGELYKDGVNQDSTPTVKFIKSTNGYTQKYRIQATIDMILATSSGEKLPLTLYSDPLSVTVQSRERLQ